MVIIIIVIIIVVVIVIIITTLADSFDYNRRGHHAHQEQLIRDRFFFLEFSGARKMSFCFFQP